MQGKERTSMLLRFTQATLLLVVAACGASPTAPPAQASGGERPFTATPVASFTSPWAMQVLPGSGNALTNLALVSEKEGKLWVVDLRNGQRQPVAGVPNAKVAGQGGLGDVVAHPGFAGNRRVYLSYAEPGPNGTSGAALGYGRLEVGQGGPRITGFKVIWRQAPKVEGNGHFSHRIAFAPDGTMFVSSGDRQKGEPAQDLAQDPGKILHLTAEGQPVAGGPWARNGARQASYWSIGHRNVLGLAFAPDGRLWAAEMGPQGGDEFNLILPGKNYGWPRASYGSDYGGKDIPDAHASAGFEEPRLWWNPAISPGGLLIYSGDLFPQWKGDGLIAALSGQALARVDINGDRAAKAEQWPMGVRIRAVDQGPRGEVYLLEDARNGTGGRLLRLEPVRR
jgi:aldose sugar dehydrogenase